MKATKTLMVAALAAAGLGMADLAAAQAKHGGHGYRGAAPHAGYRHGGHRHWGPRHRGHRHWHGSRWNWGWSLGVPLGIGIGTAWGWHDPFWDGPRVVYREVIRDEGYVGEIRPLPGEEGIRYEGEPRPEAAPAAPAQEPAAGAPTTGPLYMNYCESARAYYPKVTSCPEGWKFQTPAR